MSQWSRELGERAKIALGACACAQEQSISEDESEMRLGSQGRASTEMG
jgi:hypothetical protein